MLKTLRAKLTAALLVFVVLSLISTVAIYISANRVEHAVRVVNISGKERMLTQKMSKDADDIMIYKSGSKRDSANQANITVEETSNAAVEGMKLVSDLTKAAGNIKETSNKTAKIIDEIAFQAN